MCGILGAYSNSPLELSRILSLGWPFLKHRGDDSVGFALVRTGNGKILTDHYVRAKDPFLADVEERNFVYIAHKQILAMEPNMLFLQARYSTDDRTTDEQGNIGLSKYKEFNAQPIHMKKNSLEAILLHNGNIEESQKEWMEEQISELSSHKATVDSRYFLELYMQKLEELKDHFSVSEWMKNNIPRGSFSFIFSEGSNIVAGKDNGGIKPLCMGKAYDSDTKIIISESGLFNDFPNINFEKEISPSELVIIDQNGKLRSKELDVITYNGCCEFEDVYFKSYKSLSKNGMSIDSWRFKYGGHAAKYYKKTLECIDTVCAVPNSGNSYAEGFSFASAIKKLEAITKTDNTRYYLRARNSSDRKKNTGGHKYSIQTIDVKDKNLALVDDSIMRGDTIATLLYQLKLNGAKKINFYSMWSPNILKCDKGNDTRTNGELIAHELVNEGVIHKHNGFYIYEIENVNKRISKIVRGRIKKIDSSLYVDDISIYFAPMEILEIASPNPGCTKCLDGKELPNW